MVTESRINRKWLSADKKNKKWLQITKQIKNGYQWANKWEMIVSSKIRIKSG